jgi:hypothetical protein
MKMLEEYEDAVEFEALKAEERMDYEEYRTSRLKQRCSRLRLSLR